MTSYTGSLRFASMITGDAAVRNQWGTIWDNTVACIEQAIAGNGVISLAGKTAYTLAVANNAPDEARNFALAFVGALTANCTVSIPAAAKLGLVTNATTGSRNVILTTGSGRTLTVLPGQSLIYTCDGTNVDEFILRGATPLGSLQFFLGTAAPPRWILCYGQPVSRTTYAMLFSTIGTACGAGDGSTTFNLPDLRGRAPFGLDNMGGTAANRITLGNSGIVGTTLAAAGGDERTPYHSHSVTDPGHAHAVTDPGHSHGVSDPGHNHGITDPGHNHGILDPGHYHGVSDPGHSHGFTAARLGAGTQFGWNPAAGNFQNEDHQTNAAGTGISIGVAGTNLSLYASGSNINNQPATTGLNVGGAATGIAIQSHGTGIGIAAAGGGGSQNMPPALLGNWLIYAGV